ncbi:efflux RND transporter periplasmic adaptor subunit [Dactylosporangium sp. AC04546]|uniref:efflux RND transporter periplasmic adaptor subunit n=1 Tax=Dactylosporangium sp. AC04546 TaxID=2862460 RepID=UPI002E7BA521|nr:efflux RND transporter periplasmic adaptor subunit [Dactylosporangium sp. AC04546]WVK83500.1 efflux RND transporter periplasmic adaptor subunit [Dactylosporangium sp. AC04546]
MEVSMTQGGIFAITHFRAPEIRLRSIPWAGFDRLDLGVAPVRRLLSLFAALGLLAACTPSSAEERANPALAERGTAMTTVKPTRQDLTNRVSLSGKVQLGPTFGLVAPIDGEVRYLDVKAQTSTPTKPTKVANVWANGKATPIEVPAGALFSGRLVDDRSKVTAGMPIVSAKHVGYGIVAEIDGAQAYQISDTLESVQAQIKSGPGPFPCSVLGTLAALPAGTIPEPKQPAANPSASAPPPVVEKNPQQPSESTGMRLVCIGPADAKLINGASATVEVVTAKVSNVLVLPVEAVAGSQGQGQVEVVNADQSREVRQVTLGLSDGKVIEIKSGLNGDETIAVPGPSLPAAKPNQSGGMPFPGKS